MKIRLLKEWKNGDTVWPLGQLLQLEEKDATALIESGIAEEYGVKANDVIVASPVQADAGMTEDAIKELVQAQFTANAKEDENNRKPVPNADAEYEKAAGFTNIADFAQTIFKSGADPRNMDERLKKWGDHAKASGLSEGVSSDGGFLVPTEFRNTLMKLSLEASIIEGMTTNIPLAVNSVKIPVVTESTRASSIYGGIIVYRPAEAGVKTASKPQFGQVELNLHKLIGLCYVTDELLEDSPISMAPLLTTMFSEAIAFQKDDDYINGTGANQALGILNAPCLVTQAKISGQAATTISSENIFDMKSRLHPRSWGRAVWLANVDTYKSLRTLSLEIGTGGSVMPIFTTDGGVNRLDGMPITFTEHCQTLGTEGDLVLGDWSQYLTASKAGGGLQVATSIHLKFDYDETAFRFVVRYDGQPWSVAPLTPKNGDNTLSHFVSLAVRE